MIWIIGWLFNFGMAIELLHEKPPTASENPLWVVLILFAIFLFVVWPVALGATFYKEFVQKRRQ